MTDNCVEHWDCTLYWVVCRDCGAVGGAGCNWGLGVGLVVSGGLESKMYYLKYWVGTCKQWTTKADSSEQTMDWLERLIEKLICWLICLKSLMMPLLTERS